MLKACNIDSMIRPLNALLKRYLLAFTAYVYWHDSDEISECDMTHSAVILCGT